jgi:hypothetical protein
VVAEGGGGLLGIAIMANGDSWLAREFSAKICSEVLKRKAPTEAAPKPAQSSGDAAQAN